jgi:hypothetical protein
LESETEIDIPKLGVLAWNICWRALALGMKNHLIEGVAPV